MLSEILLFAKKVAAGLEKTVECERVGLMVIGLEVPHTHIHLIPISKEGDMNLANSRVKLSDDEFKELAEEIRKNI